MEHYTNYIVTDHHVMLGKPVLRGTRLTVELILRKLAQGATTDDLFKMYPQLTVQHLQAIFEYTAVGRDLKSRTQEIGISNPD